MIDGCTCEDCEKDRALNKALEVLTQAMADCKYADDEHEQLFVVFDACSKAIDILKRHGSV